MANYHAKRLLQPGPVVFDPVGVELQPHEREMLNHPAVGGVIFFSKNFEEPEQLRDLVRTCREARSGDLVTMVDQEGGQVQRFRSGFSRLPRGAVFGDAYAHDSQRALSAAEDVSWLCGQELSDVGIDLNLAPVADLQTNSKVIGKRAYHAEPDIAAKLTAAAVRGMQVAGVAAFNDARDERDLDDILNHDLKVFAHLIEAGVDAVMPAHVVFPAVDETPAGYSSKWIGQLLREQLGFQGAVLSDDLTMAAAGVAGDVRARARRALGAGCDLALVCQQPSSAESVLDDLSAEPFNEDRAERILSLRRPPEPRDTVEMRERAQRSLRWLQNPRT